MEYRAENYRAVTLSLTHMLERDVQLLTRVYQVTSLQHLSNSEALSLPLKHVSHSVFMVALQDRFW